METDGSNRSRFRIIFAPLAKLPLAKEVFIVEQQLVQAGARHCDEPQLRLAAAGRGATTFRDVLATTPGGLNHLIHEARTRIDELLAKRDRSIVDKRRDLK